MSGRAGGETRLAESGGPVQQANARRTYKRYSKGMEGQANGGQGNAVREHRSSMRWQILQKEMIAIIKPQIQAMVVAIGLGVVLLMPQACAKADTASPRVRLGPWARDLQVGPGMNAAGRTLRDSEFVGQNLSGAVFDGANLYGARFYQCDLSDASFRGAHFTCRTSIFRGRISAVARSLIAT
jgi:hypothetical protein